MKNYVFLLVTIFLFASCEKEADELGYPKMYYLSFELFDSEGKPVADDLIDLSADLRMDDQGRLVPDVILDTKWVYKMGKINSIETDLENLYGIRIVSKSSLYGSLSFPAKTMEEHRIYNGDEPYERDVYHLFRNSTDHTKIDTLRIRDVVRIEPYSRTFDFFLNEEPLEVQGDGKFDIYDPTYISIQVK